MNIIKIVLIVLFILFSAYAFLTDSKMHMPVIVTGTNYQISEQPQQTQKSEVKPKYNVQPVTQEIKATTAPQQKVIVQVIEEHVKTQPKTIQTTKQQPATVTKVVSQPVQTTSTQNSNQELLDRILKNAEKPVAEQEKPKVQQPTRPAQQVKTVKIEDKPLTEEEEIIVWNKWRSDLQNQVMRDSKISAPYGTTFNFSFTVDKNGNVSNINTWSDDNNYTPLAKRVIKPILTSYQHTAILKFPARTKRTIVNVTGGYTMSNTDRYSTPGDYSDYERIR